MTTTVWHNGIVWINETQTSNALAATDGLIVAHGDAALALKMALGTNSPINKITTLDKM